LLEGLDLKGRLVTEREEGKGGGRRRRVARKKEDAL
jgi:hypothetical protein